VKDQSEHDNAELRRLFERFEACDDDPECCKAVAEETLHLLERYPEFLSPLLRGEDARRRLGL
jgi:hypothetical protein